MKRWMWGAWLLVIVASFGAMEGCALSNGTVTLSQTVWDTSATFPLLPFLAGLLCGGLAVHFWWGGKGDKQVLTIDDLKRLEVRPDPSLSVAENNHRRRGAEEMRAAIINALRNGRAEPRQDAGED